MFSDTPATFAKYVLDPCTPSIKKVDNEGKNRKKGEEKKMLENIGHLHCCQRTARTLTAWNLNNSCEAEFGSKSLLGWMGGWWIKRK